MGKQRVLHTNWKRARQQLDEVFQQPQHSLVVHYSCESFYARENNPRSPRVTSIAVRNLDTGQTKSFSIHLIAERQGLLDSIEQHYDQLERVMLEDFFEEVRLRQHCKWIHWNMRDANYGFEALENRIKALGGSPQSVPDTHRCDLSRVLLSIYGADYINHSRLDNLIKKNDITAVGYLKGAEEAAAFEEKLFVKLHQSTLRKVDILATIAERAHAGDLITLATWWDINGRSIKAAVEWFREHWLLGALVALGSVVMAVLKAWPVVANFFQG